MIIKENIYIPYLNTHRTLHIYLPDIQKQKHYSVLYMFDGHNLFNDMDATYGKSWGLQRYLDRNESQLIVVGIECSHQGNNRLSEFSPYDFDDRHWGNVRSSGKDFIDWMSSDLKKHIDANYPTLQDKEHTFVGGSSMGGLMALYTGITKPNIYTKAVCISTFLEHTYHFLIQDIIKSDTLQDSTFYLSFGQREYKSKRTLGLGCESNLSIARHLQKKEAMVFTHCYLNGSHNEASWEKEIPIFMEELNIK